MSPLTASFVRLSRSAACRSRHGTASFTDASRSPGPMAAATPRRRRRRDCCWRSATSGGALVAAAALRVEQTWTVPVVDAAARAPPTPRASRRRARRARRRATDRRRHRAAAEGVREAALRKVRTRRRCPSPTPSRAARRAARRHRCELRAVRLHRVQRAQVRRVEGRLALGLAGGSAQWQPSTAELDEAARVGRRLERVQQLHRRQLEEAQLVSSAAISRALFIRTASTAVEKLSRRSTVARAFHSAAAAGLRPAARPRSRARQRRRRASRPRTPLAALLCCDRTGAT